MANLLVEVGNTAVKAAWSEGTTLGKTYRYQGEMRLDFILSLTKKEFSPRGGSSPFTRLILGFFAMIGCLMFLGCPFRMILRIASYDRVASIVAVKRLFENKACTIVDLGTTLTMDFVSATGRYAGGIISPGCRTRFKALNRYSRSLPLVDTPAEIAPEGTSIESSMETGVVSGIMFEIEGYMRLHPENILVFTGGDAIYFAKKMKNSIFVVSNLVMIGMALITDDYVRKNLQ